MKLFTNLPGTLRVFFGILRVLTALLAAFWLLVLTFNTWIQNRFTDHPRLMVSLGEISLPVASDGVGLRSDSAQSGSLALHSLRGSLQIDLCSDDAALRSAVRWAVFPSLIAIIGFSWLMFTSLRNVCANIERGEVFSERNLRLVRDIGLILIVCSLVGSGLQIWASHELGGYFNQHVLLTGLKSELHFGSGFGGLHFSRPQGLFSFPGGMVTGGLVLVVAEAFRQGLTLKTENDLTV